MGSSVIAQVSNVSGGDHRQFGGPEVGSGLLTPQHPGVTGTASFNPVSEVD
tara:strand:+ start:645 stop:797 length:153 start_codon:yes stop_codon:yes gene_type:complete